MLYFYDVFIILSEFMFTFGLETARILTETDFGYELFMKFGNPVNIDVYWPYILGAIFTSLVLAAIAENVAGKWYVTIFGVAFAASSCVCLFFHESLDIGGILMLVYISSSGVRNALLLEQTAVITLKKVRNFIFLIVAARAVAYGILHIVVLAGYNLVDRLWVIILSVTFVILYLILMIAFLHKLHTEPTYLCVYHKCAKCLIIAIKERLKNCKRKIQKTASRERPRSALRTSNQSTESEYGERKRKVTFSPEIKIMKIRSAFDRRSDVIEPRTKKKFWGNRLVRTPTPDAASEDVQYPANSRSISSERPRSSTQSIVQSIKNYIFPKKLGEQESVVFTYKNVSGFFHWLDYAKHKTSYYTAYQTWKFLSTLSIIFPPFFFTLFIFNILSINAYQVAFVARGASETRFITEYNVYFDAVLLIFFELLIYPVCSRLNMKDWHFILIGYLFLFMATLSTIWIHTRIESSLQYLPRKGYAQIRIYNGVFKEYKVEPFWEESVTPVPYFDFALFKNIPVKNPDKHKVRLTFENIVRPYDIQVSNEKTVTYIITENGLTKNSEEDPSLFKFEENYRSRIFLVTTNSSFYHLTFYGVLDNHSFTISSHQKGVPFVLNTNEYSVHVNKSEDDTIYLENIKVSSSSLFAYFVMVNETHTMKNLKVVEGPLVIHYYWILIPLFFLSLANVVTSVSYYLIVYAKSPEKLRATVLSIILSLNLTAACLFQVLLNRPDEFPVLNVLIAQTVLCAALAFFHIYISSKFEHSVL